MLCLNSVCLCSDIVLHAEHPQGGHVPPPGRTDRTGRLHLRPQEGQTEGDRNLQGIERYGL
jgi:hypothetical protein